MNFTANVRVWELEEDYHSDGSGGLDGATGGLHVHKGVKVRKQVAKEVLQKVKIDRMKTQVPKQVKMDQKEDLETKVVKSQMGKMLKKRHQECLKDKAEHLEAKVSEQISQDKEEDLEL